VPDITNVPDLGSGLIGVALRSAIIYLFVVVALRLGGKREVGQMTTPDLVVLLIVANGVQNAMVGDNTTLLGGVVSTVVIIAIARLIQIAVSRSPRLEKVLIGEPRILVVDGVIKAIAMHEEEIDLDELQAALREHGVERIEDVHLAVLEVDGSISVIPAERGGAQGGGTQSGGPGPRRAGRLPGGRRIGRRAGDSKA
jgi:uncharacterized membrane protein YcaP (DUF421 family)